MDDLVANGTYTGMFDAIQYAQNPNDPSKWIATGVANATTADGIHPSTAVILNMKAAPAAAIAAGLFGPA